MFGLVVLQKETVFWNSEMDEFKDLSKDKKLKSLP